VTFLAPSAGLIAGAVLVPILLALYFLKLRRRPVRVSSTLLWRRAVHDLQVNAPFKMIKPSWLLLLQLLALASLLVAFARPAVDVSRGPTDRLVILIDRSASMSAADGTGPEGRTRLDQAKAEALELIDRHNRSGDATGKAEAIVIAFAHDARALTRFTGNRATLERAVESIQPTDQGADFPAALRLVRTLITRTGDVDTAAATPATIALLSDGSFEQSQEPASLGAVGAQLRFIQTGPPALEPAFNIGIVAAGAQRDFEDASLVRVFARLLNTSPEPVKVAVSLFARDQRVGVRTVDCPPASGDGPGDAVVTFELRGQAASAPGVVALRLHLTVDDELASDNDAFMTLAPATPARVLAVGPATGGRPDGDLLRALEVTSGRAPTPTSFAAYESSPPTGAGDGGYDLIVFDRCQPSALPAAPSLSFAAGLPIEGLRVGTRAESDRPTMIVWWRRTSPLLRQVALGSVEVYRPRRITLDGERDRPGPGAEDQPEQATQPRAGTWDIQTIARGLDGPLLLELERAEERRAIVAFAVSDSNWATSVSFPIFIANALERLAQAGAGAQAKSVTTIDPVTLRAAPGVDEIVLERAGVTERVAAVRPGGAGAVPIGAIEHAGLYTAQGADPSQALLAVNLFDATESALATVDSVRVAGEDIPRGGIGQAAPKEIWPLFVLIAFALLVVEWVLFTVRSKV